MTEITAQFIDTIPDIYEDHLGPLLFHFHAQDLANRLAVKPDGHVLETACGTGISTKFSAKPYLPAPGSQPPTLARTC